MLNNLKEKRSFTNKHRVFCVIILVVFVIWLNNTSIFHSGEQDYKLLAHRGLAQTYDGSKINWSTNTAAIIYEPEHEYLENTIVSMQAAFDYGADVVEFDVKLSSDKILAVFHDSPIEYRTDMKGEVGDYTMEELKKMDIGYGYTADDGKTFPFRGKGIGLMPTIDEVFFAFPDKDLLIHVKDGNVETYEVLWEKLNTLPKERLKGLTVYGDNEGIAYLRKQSSSLRLLSMDMLKKALLEYEMIGFTGYVPKSMHNMELHIPLRYAKYLWGWPYKFVKRMESVNTRVVIVEGNAKLSEGFDTKESLTSIPNKYEGYVWTNRIDRIASQ